MNDVAALKDLTDLADIVYKLGFPVFVAVYLLLRVDRVLSAMVTQSTALITQNAEMLGLLRDVRTALMVQANKETRQP